MVLTNQSSSENTHILDGVVWQWSGSLKRNVRDMETKETEEETNQRTTCQFFLLFFKTKNIKKKRLTKRADNCSSYSHRWHT